MGEEGVLGCFPGKNSEIEGCMQELYQGVILGPALMKERRSRIGHREKLGCGAIPTEASGATMRTSRAGITMQSCSSSSKGSGLLYKILHEPVMDELCPEGGT